MSLALDSTDCGLTIQGQDLSYRYIGNLPVGLERNDVSRSDDISIYGNLLGEKLSLAKLALIASGEPQRLSTLAGNRVISFAISSLHLGDGTMRIVTVVQDITKARRREATMRTLLLELSHRSKNLLAIVQGLATQSAKHARSINEFMPAFIGRLHAVSGAQDVIVDANWQKASLHELAKRQLQAISSDSGTKIRFSGPDIELDPNQSLHLGLALHELAMTSSTTKSTTDRRVTIEAGGDDDVFIQWRSEPGVDRAELAANFGTTLLERIVPSALSGESTYSADAKGVSWRIEFPLDIQKKRRGPKQSNKNAL